MKRRILALAAALILAGCGARGELRLPENHATPPAPYGTDVKPGPDELLKPPPQTRPARSDDLIQSTDKRRSDEFDLPPS